MANQIRNNLKMANILSLDTIKCCYEGITYLVEFQLENRRIQKQKQMLENKNTKNYTVPLKNRSTQKGNVLSSGECQREVLPNIFGKSLFVCFFAKHILQISLQRSWCLIPGE